eukprot:CAMPEP_0181052700 /NCGR_PEP_ID=MMETSP1070-20121207/17728_1 /TAXON_ID=265543 /ORGANISM="Minutocellus polymorphus, Strain NH13" /LENGTH=287 /DNA_ID=CAMNT_0023131807 /DNA_START=50 /DNA_END=910 /DNA_ORIENTATION=+
MTSTSDDDDEQEQPPHDLSPYELLRLEKIRRNQAKLEALGLGGGSIGTLAGVTPKKRGGKQKKRSRSNADAAEDRRMRRRRQQPTRSSKRVRDMKEKHSSPTSVSSNVDTTADSVNKSDDAVEDDDGKQVVIDYDCLPQEPDQLDDDEFQVYTSLRAWRLRRKNELEVEPYKICQNRTLCELIRRVRNDPSWGAALAEKAEGGRSKSSSKKRSEEDVAADLIECWGLGPSKVAADGFGPEMMVVIAEKDNVELLEASRALTCRSSSKGYLLAAAAARVPVVMMAPGR